MAQQQSGNQGGQDESDTPLVIKYALHATTYAIGWAIADAVVGGQIAVVEAVLFGLVAAFINLMWTGDFS